jgi:hypothetical protein
MKNILKIEIECISELLAFAFVFLVCIQPVMAEQITAGSVIKYANLARESQNIQPLASNGKLTDIAKDKLNDMIKNKYFAHTSPAGLNPWYWFGKVGYDYQYAGENLAINFITAEDQQAAWMKSPTHRKNIMNPKYLETGVAVGAGEIDGQLSIISVEEFGSPVGAAIPNNNGQSFSTDNNSNLIKEDGKIIPQVLSMKSPAGNNAFYKNQSELSQSYKIFIDVLSIWAALMFLTSITLLPIVFLSKAFDKIWIIHESGKEENNLTNQGI